MTVQCGLRRRFNTFCALALDSIATQPSRKPYHIATMWMDPSGLTVAMDIE